MVKINNEEYESLSCDFVTPCYIYTEGEKREEYWVDEQNAIYYYLEEDSDDIPGTIKESELKHWLICLYKPKGIQITEDNEDLIKYLVWLGPKEDMHKEWDFDNHCVVD